MQIWLEEKGADKTLDFLNHCPLESTQFFSLLGKHLKLLVNVTRAEQFISPLVERGLVDHLLRVLDCPSDKIRSAVLKLIGLVSSDESARRQILEGNLIPEMLQVVTGKDDVFLNSVLPRLLRDEKLAICFCQYGGIALLQKTMTMGAGNGITGAIVGISLLSQYPSVVKMMVDEEEFVSSLVMMLSYQQEGVDMSKLKVLILKALFHIASDASGMSQIKEQGPLPLMEMIEHAAENELSSVVAAFEVLNLLCADKEMRDEVDRLGAQDFVTLLFAFISSKRVEVLEPLCRLFRALAAGDNRIQIIEGLKQELSRRPDMKLFQETLDAISGNRLSKASTIGTQAIEGDDTAQRLPQRRMTKESATMRQGAKRIQVIKEIVTTERTYCASLDSLMKSYYTPLKANSSGRGALITAAEVEDIFINSAKIQEFHRGLLKKLEALTSKNPSATVSGWFSEMADRLVEVYKPFFNRYRDSLTLLQRKLEKRAFAKFLAKCGKDSKEALQLESLLIMPIQRLPRYGLLLQELERVTIDSHPEKPILTSVAKKLANKVAVLNDATELPPSAAERAAQEAPLMRFTSFVTRSGTRAGTRTSTGAEQHILKEGLFREFIEVRKEGETERKKRKYPHCRSIRSRGRATQFLERRSCSRTSSLL